MRRKKKKEPKRKLHYTKLWKQLVTVSVILMIASIALEVFFREPLEKNGTLDAIQVADIPISIFLMIDIYLHYKDAKNKKKFVRTHMLQIISVLPIAGMLVMFRTLRIVPFLAEMPLLAELTAAEKITKLEKSFRFFEGLRELLWIK